MNFDKAIQQINPEEDYKIPEVAKIIGVSYSCVLAHVRRENIPSRKIFSRVYVKGSDIISYLTNGKK